jgi:TolA-binding protein
MLATTFCSSLLEKWPQSEKVPEATIYLGYYSQKDGRNDAALAAFKQYLEKWPSGEDAEFAGEQIKKLEAPPEGSSE